MTIVVAFNFPQDEQKYEHFLQASKMANMLKQFQIELESHYEGVHNEISGDELKALFDEYLLDYSVDIEKL